MTIPDAAEAVDLSEERQNRKELGDVVLEPKFTLKPVESRTPFYAVGKGVFESAEHCAAVCGAEEMPDHAAMGYTPEVLAYLRAPKDCSDRHLWP